MVEPLKAQMDHKRYCIVNKRLCYKLIPAKESSVLVSDTLHYCVRCSKFLSLYIV